MASVVASSFHDATRAGLDPDWAEMLRAPSGGGPEFREMHRALQLGDRAARDWVGSAIAHLRPGAPNSFELLPVLGKPEAGLEDLQAAASLERRAAAEGRDRELALLASELGEAIGELDTEASNQTNAAAFREVGHLAGKCLLSAGNLLGGDSFVLEQANATLLDLIALTGWENQLGPRFE